MLGRRVGIVMVWLRGTKKRERKGVQGGICVEDGTIDGGSVEESWEREDMRVEVSHRVSQFYWRRG